MARYPCYLVKNEKIIDDNCVVGYDKSMETFFFHSGSADKDGNPRIWLGKEYKEFETLSELQISLSENNYLLLINDNDRRLLLKNIPGYRLLLSDILREFKSELFQQGKFINIVIIPLNRLIIENQIDIGKFKLFPSGSLNISDILSNLHFSNKEKWIEVYEKQTLLTFVTNKEIEYPFGADEDNEYFEQCIEEANSLLDLIKHLYCHYDRPQTYPSHPGLVKEGVSTMINYIYALHTPQFYCKKLSARNITLGRGLKISKFIFLKEHINIFVKINEVGQVLRHALKLNRIIFDIDNATTKFIQIMSMFDFLAFPDTYERFSEVKQKIIVHIAKNSNEFKCLNDRFLELTGKATRNENGKKIYQGIRTRIVHLGHTLEQILLSKYEIRHLFQELQNYCYAIFEDMFQCAHLTWKEFEDFRKLKNDEIQKNNSIHEKEYLLANTIMLIDIGYLNKVIPRVINFYQKLYSSKQLNNLKFTQLFADLCRNGRAIEPSRVIPIICFCSPNEKIVHCENGDLELWENKMFKLDETIYQIFVNHSKSVAKFLTSEVDRFSQDGNAINSINGQFTKFIICADESKTYENYFRHFDFQNYDFMFIRTSNSNTSFPDNVSQSWVKIDYVIAHSLGLERDEL